MNNDEMMKMAVAAHMQQFVHTVTDAMKDFVSPLDPSDGPEEMAYIRRVIEAVDNLVLVTLMHEDDEVAKEQMKLSTDRMLQNLIEYHNENAAKH